MFCVLSTLIMLAFVYDDINFAHSVGTQTRALYVDEGFYSDAAQNLIKTGTWEIAHDSRHWPGSPLSLVLQSVVFTLFGASITVARLLSVLLGAIGAWALFSMAKLNFSPGVSVLLTLSSIATITFVTVARLALTDPMAMSMSLLAMWVFSAMSNRHLALPLSLGFAFLAFFSKMYFLFAFATMIAVWFGELILQPLIYRSAINWRLVREFFYSLLVVAFLYGLYRFVYIDEISNFMAINQNKKPYSDFVRWYGSIKHSMALLPRHTQSAVFFGTLLVSIAYAIGHFITVRWVVPQKTARVLASLRKINRAEWAMGLFLISGLITIGSLRLHKTHYHFFAIIPFAFLAISAIYHQLPAKLAGYASIVILIAHVAFQVPAYSQWFNRPGSTSIADSTDDMAAHILRDTPSGMIPVFGEYSAQLGLYSDRIISIDAKWVNQTELCERVRYWKPRYHTNVVWPRSASLKMLSRIAACPVVTDTREVKRYRTFGELNDYLVLNRIDYVENKTPSLPLPFLLF